MAMLTEVVSEPHSCSWQDRAARVLTAGGFGNFDPGVVIKRGSAARVWDTDDREYVDFLIGSGPMIVGHAHPEVVDVVQKQVADGTTFFASNPHGIALAEEICSAVACAEEVRYGATGTEAILYAVRVARAFTGRPKILKFEGGYHGTTDEAQMSLAPKRLANFPQAVPDSAGISEHVRDHVLVAPFNDADAVIKLLDEHDGEIAAVLAEPLQRLIPPTPGFLETLRAETKRRGVLLIFDEIVTGFRLAYGGAQEAYGVTPDLCTLGKTVGGGFPLSAIAGRADVMALFDEALSGDQHVSLGGTLSGNPVASVAGLKTLQILRREGVYEKIENTGRQIMSAIANAFSKRSIPVQVVGVPVMFDAVFTSEPVRDYRAGFRANRDHAKIFNRVLRDHGILKPPSKFYISLAHTKDDVAQVTTAIDAAAEAVANA